MVTRVHLIFSKTLTRRKKKLEIIRTTNFKILNCEVCKQKGEQKKNGCKGEKPTRFFSYSFEITKCPILYLRDDCFVYQVCKDYNLVDGRLSLSEISELPMKYTEAFEYIKKVDADYQLRNK